MNRKDLIFLAVIIAIIALFIVLSKLKAPPAAMATRPEHAGMTEKTSRETCFQCHAPDSTIAPMPATHPRKGKPDEKVGKPESEKTPCAECHKPPPHETSLFNPSLPSSQSREDLFLWPKQQPN